MKERETVNHSTLAVVQKWDGDQVEYVKRKTGLLEPKGADLVVHVSPYETVKDDTPNLTVTSGLGILTNCLIGTAGTSFDAANQVVLGVGSSSTAAIAADTNLTTQSWWQILDGVVTRTTVTVTNDSIVCVATVGASNGNVAWNEWGLALATTGTLTSATTLAGTGTATLFNHKAPVTLGTKASPAVWTFTVTLTWS